MEVIPPGGIPERMPAPQALAHPFTDLTACNRTGYLADYAATLTDEGRERVRASIEPQHMTAFDMALNVALHRAQEGTYGKLVRALVDASDVDSLPDPEPLIDGILDRDSLVWMYGPPGSYKSFLALHMAACVVAGRDLRFCGHAVKHTGTVLYLYAEGTRGVKKRVKAWERHYKRSMCGVKIIPMAVQLLDDEQLDAFVRLCRETRPVLVVIDTQSRCTVGMDENSNGQMGEVVAAADRVRQATGACVLIIHHTGRDGKNLRGASAMDGAADATIKVDSDKVSGTVTMLSGKQKDDAAFPPITLSVQAVAESVILSHEPVGICTSAEERVLRCLSESPTAALSRTEIVQLTDIPKTTVYRTVEVLVSKGLAMNVGTVKRPLYCITQGQDQLSNSHESH
ncbi:hypothetical protein GCM10010451_04900 [Streptomyces virens]|uniref:HTH iclR-type domain-containing protein n=1 Tax=Streptomyces virens TaxID=285572 RepID=A0ABP6NWK1_9ACTN|nr:MULTISPECIES: AAA family ATPase [Streptomyces]MBA8975545.1 hypothetical protein [Streptomyces calvus]MYS27933.1 AAA family ATPase [Streptomyces sp. SID7804]